MNFEVFVIEVLEERKYTCNHLESEDDAIFVKNACGSKIYVPSEVEVLPFEEAVENCEQSISTRCILDDRKSEDLIKEKQMPTKYGRNMKGPIQHKLEVQGLEVESSSNAQIPPGFEDFITEIAEFD
ncbi:hypothetical protein PIB30_041577 [Stylosanthes scabra]|uniref:Uncharacterized protein n=1 Tax=Stylosanthes scabra TaxID=79078 RepID=A0ABU6RF45_9FABA|nr:hypothetical protein [Stylosanthes scabra]